MTNYFEDAIAEAFTTPTSTQSGSGSVLDNYVSGSTKMSGNKDDEDEMILKHLQSQNINPNSDQGRNLADSLGAVAARLRGE